MPHRSRVQPGVDADEEDGQAGPDDVGHLRPARGFDLGRGGPPRLGGRPAALGRGGARAHATSRRAKASGSNGARSSRPSPVPTNRTGTPSSSRTATTIPPRAVPSILERMMPVIPIAWVNALAWAIPF